MTTFIPQLLPVEYNQEQRRLIVLTNVVKMLTERGLMKFDQLEDNIKDIISKPHDDDVYSVSVNSQQDKDYFIILLNQKITSITKHSLIGEYIFKDKNVHKVIVITDISPRSRQSIQNNFPKIELFLEKELMFNLVDSIYVPKHQVLSQEESDAVIKEYNVTKRQLPRILTVDPVARYYNMQTGQICRITRPSETSGLSNYYRIVVNMEIPKK